MAGVVGVDGADRVRELVQAPKTAQALADPEPVLPLEVHDGIRKHGYDSRARRDPYPESLRPHICPRQGPRLSVGAPRGDAGITPDESIGRLHEIECCVDADGGR
jgi:hypothetical protein